jgi:Leu/Phe-tRNA-protein transferase
MSAPPGGVASTRHAGGFFAASRCFTARPTASKAAVGFLIERLRRALLAVRRAGSDAAPRPTGAINILARDYLGRLRRALAATRATHGS